MGAYPLGEFDEATQRVHKRATSASGFLTELLDSEGSVLLDDEHAAALRDRLDDLTCETENGGLVRRAVADDERATAMIRQATAWKLPV